MVTAFFSWQISSETYTQNSVDLTNRILREQPTSGTTKQIRKQLFFVKITR
jgi:hypothetical protein